MRDPGAQGHAGGQHHGGQGCDPHRSMWRWGYTLRCTSSAVTIDPHAMLPPARRPLRAQCAVSAAVGGRFSDPLRWARPPLAIMESSS